MARPDFRAAAARRLSEERELSAGHRQPAVARDAPHRRRGVKLVPVDRIEPNPRAAAPRVRRGDPRASSPRPSASTASSSRSSSGRIDDGRFQLIAGERRWRASKIAGQPTIPALVEDIDDDTALEISIIENLQREDLSPLDEAAMYDRMIRDHGYSIRKLAEKLGKDKGYLENRLRLADAPPEVRELVSLRKDTLSHAYELMKVEDPKKRRRLADQVARSELSLVKLREKIEGRPAADRRRRRGGEPRARGRRPSRRRAEDDRAAGTAASRVGIPIARRQPRRRQAAAQRGRRGAARRHPQPGRPRRDRPDRPGEPRQVPDDREAPARERDRRGPDRGHGPLGRRSALADTKKPAPEAPASCCRGDRPGSVALGGLPRGLRGVARPRLALGLGGVPLGLRGILARPASRGSLAACPASARRTPRA